MIIEYIGLPGGGKTYHAERFCDANKGYTLIKIRTKLEKYILCTLYFILHPRISLNLLKITIINTRRNHTLLRYKLFSLLLASIAREVKSSFYKNSVIDEGLCQFMLSLYEDIVDYETVLSDWNLFIQNSKKRIIISIETNRELREKRMVVRQRSPRSIFPSTYQRHFAQIIEVNYYIIKEVLQSNYSTKIKNND